MNSEESQAPQWTAIPSRQRRLLGVLMEKAKTTPDVYPLSIASLVAGANQKSNRYPLMNLTPEQVEDELSALRRLGAAAEVQGSGRVPRYRHYGHAWLGVKGAEAAVMIELLLRGQQTAGDLRTRASRFEPIADLSALQTVLDSLMERNLVIALTPPGRGQLLTHNLYTVDELRALKSKIVSPTEDESNEEDLPSPVAAAPRSVSQSTLPAVQRPDSGQRFEERHINSSEQSELAQLRVEVRELREAVNDLQQRLADLERAVHS